jgi:hypothetical protein
MNGRQALQLAPLLDARASRREAEHLRAAAIWYGLALAVALILPLL